MTKYLVECKVDTYLTAEIEAYDMAEAVRIAMGGNEKVPEPEWNHETDYDSSTVTSIKEIQ